MNNRLKLGLILASLSLMCSTAFALVAACPSAEYFNNNPQFFHEGRAFVPGLGSGRFAIIVKVIPDDAIGEWFETEVFGSQTICWYRALGGGGSTGAMFRTDSSGWKPHVNGPPWSDGERCKVDHNECQVSNT